MSNVKIMNPVEGETNEQRIKRCANNLIKAVLAAGYDIRKTAGVSGFDIDIFSHSNNVEIRNVLCNWTIRCGKPPVKVEFANMYTPTYDARELTESEE